MTKYSILFALLILLTACDETPVRITDSAGKLNGVLVVINNENWDGALGDTIRHTLARPVDGIIREEPLFTLNQIKTASFKGMMKKSRNFLQVIYDDSTSVSVKKDRYANPQIGVIIKAPDAQAMMQAIAANQENIIQVFTNGEIIEKQRLIAKTRLNTDRISQRFNIDIKIPNAYKYAAPDDDDFFWIRRRIKQGTMDLMLYEVPLAMIQRDSNIVKHIVNVRDSIGGLKINVDKPGRFRTWPMFSPFVNDSQIDGQFAYQTKGTWDIEHQFMAGPFINYAIYNKQRNNWLMVEGYVSAPNADQRNYVFEIEAILRSIKFLEPQDN